MDENTQILDVTYGNFSCRLEGFEDSVETMKTVVAYFHELAGHDRFMDITPQAPDMATLAALTEAQIGAPVDVEGEGNQVSLRVRKDPVEDDLSDDIAALEDAIADDADAQADEDAVDDVAVVDAGADDFDFDVDASVADKLERIRAVVDDGAASDTEDYAEDLSDDAETMAGSDDDELAQLKNVFDDGRVDEDVATEDAVADDDMVEEIAAADDLDALEDSPDVEDEDADDLAAALDAIDDEDNVDEAVSTEAEAEAADIEMADDAEASDDEVAEDEVAEDDLAEADEDHDDADEASDDTDRSPLVLTASDAVSEAEEPAPKKSRLGDYGDGYNLQEEVAKVEAEIAARQGNEVARHGLPRSVEDAMSRIMSQTDQHLNQPESRRHRDAFAQLKAAVAATEAARQLGDQSETRDPDADFKDDLGAHDAEEMNQDQSTPPLKLIKSEMISPEDTLEKPADDVVAEPVEKKQPASAAKTRMIEVPAPEAEQKPQAPKPMDAASERLRKIAAQKETDGAIESTGFAEFATSHGATDLVDQLEAAGAYICFVEGNSDFSRPQVMKVVQSASKEEITREDGLRCFGRLLRQARLVKLSNGRFQVAETTQYRPEGDKAAQG